MIVTNLHAFYLTDFDIELEMNVTLDGHMAGKYRPATQWEPEEHPEPEYDEVKIDTSPIDDLIGELQRVKKDMHDDVYEYVSTDDLDDWLTEAYEEK